MRKIQIMTDSASDISVENEQKYNLPIIPFPITIGEKSYLSRVEINNQQFFELMTKSDGIPKTAQITPYQFVEIYLEQAKQGVEDLILVLINSKGSQTYANSVAAIDMFFEEHPEYKDKMSIYSIDGMGYSSLYGVPVLQAIEMRDNGATAKEIVDFLNDVIPQRQIFFGIYELKYAAKSGRIPTAAAFVGNIMNIKPIMRIFDREIKTAAKCIGEKNLLKKLVELTKQEMVPGTPYELIYARDTDCMEEFRKMIVEALGYEPSDTYQTGAAVSANAGPRIAGISFLKRK